MLRRVADALHATLPRASDSDMPSSMPSLGSVLVASPRLPGGRRAQRAQIGWIESKGDGESKSKSKGESKSKTDLTMVGDHGCSSRQRNAWIRSAVALLTSLRSSRSLATLIVIKFQHSHYFA